MLESGTPIPSVYGVSSPTNNQRTRHRPPTITNDNIVNDLKIRNYLNIENCKLKIKELWNHNQPTSPPGNQLLQDLCIATAAVRRAGTSGHRATPAGKGERA